METEREKIEREFNEAERRKRQADRDERKRHVLASLHLLPEGWEAKVSAAVVEALKSGSEDVSVELVTLNSETKRSVAVRVLTHLYAADYSDEIKAL